MKTIVSYLLLTLGLTLTARGQANREEARRIDFPDVQGYQTLVTDLHTHTVFSDGSVWPDIRVQEAMRDGLDAVAITDHLEYQPHEDDIPHPDRNRSHEVAVDAAGDDDLLVIRGSEITRSMPPGHTNAIFLHDANPLLQDDPIAVFQEAKRQGAFIFWNHPMWTNQAPDGIAALSELHHRLIREGMLHGIEVVNEHTYSDEALQIALDHDLTIVGTSDIHGLIDWQHEVHYGGHRPVTLAFVRERSEAGLKEALMDGRTVVWYENLLIGKADMLSPLIAASLSVTEAAYQGDSSVLTITLANTSEAEFLLDNRSPYTFHSDADIVTVAPHTTTALEIKTTTRLSALDLTFEVLNAVVAPDQHPVVSFAITVGDAE